MPLLVPTSTENLDLEWAKTIEVEYIATVPAPLTLEFLQNKSASDLLRLKNWEIVQLLLILNGLDINEFGSFKGAYVVKVQEVFQIATRKLLARTELECNPL